MKSDDFARTMMSELVSVIDSGAGHDGYRKRFLHRSPDGSLVWYYDLASSSFDIIVESSALCGCGNSLNTKSIRIREALSIDRVRHFLHIELVELRDIKIFSTLVLDLINYTDGCTSPENGIALLTERFLMWKAMLKHQGEDVRNVRGVIGELYTMLALLDEGCDPDDVVNSWTGPEYSKQDFMMLDKWVEAKTVNSYGSLVTISSLGQLDNNERPGFLFVVKIDQCDDDDPDAVTVQLLYDRICAKLRNIPSAKLAFLQKMQNYEYIRFLLPDPYVCKVVGEKNYTVKDDFPRLLDSYQMTGIRSVHYDLELSVLENWIAENGRHAWTIGKTKRK